MNLHDGSSTLTTPGSSVPTLAELHAIGAAQQPTYPDQDALAEAVANVKAIITAGESEGIPFQLNARTDAFVRGGDRPLETIIEDAITRGRAYLDAGAALVFVPGILNREVTEQLVAGLGEGTISVIGLPGALSAAEYEALGVARISYGPLTQRHALRAFRDLAVDLYGTGVVPTDTPALN